MTRKNQRKKFGFLFLLPALAMGFLAGCDKPNIAFGTNFVNNNSTNVIEIDTFTTNLSTVQIDSFSTSGTGSLLIGSYDDPFLGNITARTYFQISKPTTLPAITSSAIFDSISLILRINKTFYGDTTIPQHYYVSQLTTNYKEPLPPAQQSFFNTSSVSYDPSPLGEKTVTIRPVAGITESIATKDTVAIQLPDTLGRSFMHMLFTNSQILTNQANFLNYFNGITIYSDDNSKGVIFGFKDTVMIRLVYHEPGANFRYVNVEFPLYNKSFQFNQILADRSATPLAILKTIQENRTNPAVPAEAPSNQTGGESFVQSITGIQTKITFPYIFSLSQQPDYLGILKAILIIKPVGGTYSPKLALPPKLVLSPTNQTNLPLGGSLTFGGAIEAGNLVTDYITGENTAYSYDVTAYLQQQVTIPGINRDGLFLDAPSPASNTIFNRVVLGDKTNKIYNIKLKLYYVSFPH